MGNKNKLKNINEQNFAHFIRGYDKGFYGMGFYFDRVSLSYTSADIFKVEYYTSSGANTIK